MATYQAPQRASNFSDVLFAADAIYSSPHSSSATSSAFGSSSSVLEESGISKVWIMGGDDYMDPNAGALDDNDDSSGSAGDQSPTDTTMMEEEAAYRARKAAPVTRLRNSRKALIDSNVNDNPNDPQSPLTGGGGLRNDVWLWRTSGPRSHWKVRTDARGVHRGPHGQPVSAVISTVTWAQVGVPQSEALPPLQYRLPGGGGYRRWLCCIGGERWFPCNYDDGDQTTTSSSSSSSSSAPVDRCSDWRNVTGPGAVLRKRLRWSPRRGHATLSLYGIATIPSMDASRRQLRDSESLNIGRASGRVTYPSTATRLKVRRTHRAVAAWKDGGGSGNDDTAPPPHLHATGSDEVLDQYAAQSDSGNRGRKLAGGVSSVNGFGFVMVVLGGRARSLEDISESQAVGAIPLPAVSVYVPSNSSNSSASTEVTHREATILTNDVWASIDGASWTLVNGGCYVPQLEHSPQPGTVEQRCANDNDCYTKRFGNAHCMQGMCVCRYWSPRERFAAAVVNGSSIVVSGGLTSVHRGMCGDYLCPASYPLLLNDVWLSSDTGESWIQLTPAAPWSPRCDHALAFVRRMNGLWLFGGRSGAALRMYNGPESASFSTSSSPSSSDIDTADNNLALRWPSDLLAAIDSSPHSLLSDSYVSYSSGASWTLNSSSAPWPERAGFAVVANDSRL